MSTRSKVLGNGTIRGEEALRVPGGLEPLHAPLPLARRLMGVFRAVIQIPVLAVLHPRQQFLPKPGSRPEADDSLRAASVGAENDADIPF